MTANDQPESHDHTFDGQWWEQHHRAADPGAPAGAASAHLLAEVAGKAPGTVLDAGCGTGADAMGLALAGWDVTAVDVSPTAVERARTVAVRDEPDAARRIEWLVADLTVWRPPRRYDLVVSQYVHPDMPFVEFVARLADAVAPGGILLVVGHDHADSHSAAHAPRPASIGPEAVTGALDPDVWDVAVAESRVRQVVRGSTRTAMADVVVKAVRARSG